MPLLLALFIYFIFVIAEVFANTSLIPKFKQPFVPWSVKEEKTEPGLAGLTNSSFHQGPRA